MFLKYLREIWRKGTGEGKWGLRWTKNIHSKRIRIIIFSLSLSITAICPSFQILFLEESSFVSCSIKYYQLNEYFLFLFSILSFPFPFLFFIAIFYYKRYNRLSSFTLNGYSHLFYMKTYTYYILDNYNYNYITSTHPFSSSIPLSNDYMIFNWYRVVEFVFPFSLALWTEKC